MAPQRGNQFKILLSDEELRVLKEKAEAEGVTASDYVRSLIRGKRESEPSFEYVVKLADRLEALGAKGPKVERLKQFRDKVKKLRTIRGR